MIVLSILVSIVFTLVGCVFVLGMLKGIREGIQGVTKDEERKNK